MTDALAPLPDVPAALTAQSHPWHGDEQSNGRASGVDLTAQDEVFAMVVAMGRRKKSSWMTAEKFKHIRLHILGLTQEELGALIDTSGRQISQFERGTQPIPKGLAAAMLNAHRPGFKWPKESTR